MEALPVGCEITDKSIMLDVKSHIYKKGTEAVAKTMQQLAETLKANGIRHKVFQENGKIDKIMIFWE